MRRVYLADGNVAATVDASGNIMLGSEPGPIVGVIRSGAEVYAGEAGGEWLGRVDADGRIFDAQYTFVGHFDASGRVLDQTGRLVASAGAAVDAAAFLLLVAALVPDAVVAPRAPASEGPTLMDEVTSLADDNARPHVRKNYKPLTDDDIFGKPFKK